MTQPDQSPEAVIARLRHLRRNDTVFCEDDEHACTRCRETWTSAEQAADLIERLQAEVARLTAQRDTERAQFAEALIHGADARVATVRAMAAAQVREAHARGFDMGWKTGQLSGKPLAAERNAYLASLETPPASEDSDE